MNTYHLSWPAGERATQVMVASCFEFSLRLCVSACKTFLTQRRRAAEEKNRAIGFVQNQAAPHAVATDFAGHDKFGWRLL
jgi:hypothetical protein